MASGPSTEAGRALLAIPLIDGDDAPLDLSEDIAAIEAEARAQALAEVRAALPTIEGHPHAEANGSRYWIDRAAVLRVLDNLSGEPRE